MPSVIYYSDTGKFRHSRTSLTRLTPIAEEENVELMIDTGEYYYDNNNDSNDYFQSNDENDTTAFMIDEEAATTTRGVLQPHSTASAAVATTIDEDEAPNMRTTTTTNATISIVIGLVIILSITGIVGVTFALLTATSTTIMIAAIVVFIIITTISITTTFTIVRMQLEAENEILEGAGADIENNSAVSVLTQASPLHGDTTTRIETLPHHNNSVAMAAIRSMLKNIQQLAVKSFGMPKRILLRNEIVIIHLLESIWKKFVYLFNTPLQLEEDQQDQTAEDQGGNNVGDDPTNMNMAPISHQEETSSSTSISHIGQSEEQLTMLKKNVSRACARTEQVLDEVLSDILRLEEGIGGDKDDGRDLTPPLQVTNATTAVEDGGDGNGTDNSNKPSSDEHGNGFTHLPDQHQQKFQSKDHKGNGDDLTMSISTICQEEENSSISNIGQKEEQLAMSKSMSLAFTRTEQMLDEVLNDTLRIGGGGGGGGGKEGDDDDLNSWDVDAMYDDRDDSEVYYDCDDGSVSSITDELNLLSSYEGSIWDELLEAEDSFRDSITSPLREFADEDSETAPSTSPSSSSGSGQEGGMCKEIMPTRFAGTNKAKDYMNDGRDDDEDGYNDNYMNDDSRDGTKEGSNNSEDFPSDEDDDDDDDDDCSVRSITEELDLLTSYEDSLREELMEVEDSYHRQKVPLRLLPYMV